ncbi:flavin reductase (plasmid) [Paraburkholderia sp. PREW-6R]|uniref:flavin reductase n=1 Tax=Paraburkholderia sp. PREW-6R TaxID=3141544 RepID=UPI0031F4F305
MTNDQDLTRTLFRNAMAALGAAVNVITTDGPRGRCGITASAVCSVTDSPPTMLVCINQSSYVHDILPGNERVCINVLGANAEEAARVFAGMTGCSMDERFEQCASRVGRSSVPVLDDAIATLEGRIVDSKTVGSHSVFFVEVDHIDTREHGDGLVWFGRQFHRLARAGATCGAA